MVSCKESILTIEASEIELTKVSSEQALEPMSKRESVPSFDTVSAPSPLSEVPEESSSSVLPSLYVLEEVVVSLDLDADSCSIFFKTALKCGIMDWISSRLVSGASIMLSRQRLLKDGVIYSSCSIAVMEFGWVGCVGWQCLDAQGCCKEC